MPIILTPEQICKYWDIIKYAAVSADYVDKNTDRYLNNLLYMLLSGKSQCVFSIDENRNVRYVAISRVEVDPVTDEKMLNINCIYSFSKTPIDEWGAGLEELIKYARSAGCKYIVAATSNDRVMDICRGIGLNYSYTVFEKEI